MAHAFFVQLTMRRKLVLAAVSGVLLAMALPKPGIWVASWFGLVPLLIAIRGTRAREAALLGLVCGLAYYGIILYWLSLLDYWPWVALTLLESAFMALFAASASQVRARAIWLNYLAVPAAWTAMQWLRCFGIFGCTLGSFAHSQANNLPVIQLGSVTGPWGIELLVCLVNVALADALLPDSGRRRLAPVAAVLALVLAVVGFGHVVLRGVPSRVPKTKVAVIQGNILGNGYSASRDATKSLLAYRKLSRAAAVDKPDLIVWPETVLSAPVRDVGLGASISALAASTNSNYVVGAYDEPDDPFIAERYNSAFFYDRRGKKIGVYHKVCLVPFGEFVPFREQMPWLAGLSFRDVDVLPATRHKVVRTEIGKIGTAICFESLFAGISREQTLRGATALIVITNDSWFGRSPLARQHMMMSRLRAIENRRYVVHGGSTGISAIVDPYGRVMSELEVFKQGIVAGKIAGLRTLTPYARYGDWLAYVCAALATAMTAAGLRKRKRRTQAKRQ